MKTKRPIRYTPIRCSKWLTERRALGRRCTRPHGHEGPCASTAAGKKVIGMDARDKIEVGDLVEVTEGGESGCYFVGPNPWTARVEHLYKKDGTEILVQAEPPIPNCKHTKMALSSHDKVRVLEKRRVRRNNEVCGLTAGLFQRVEEELLKAPPSQSRAYAIRCLTEIHDQFDERHNAARDAEQHFHALWEAAEAARHKLHEAHVDFGGTWEPNPLGKLTS